MKPTDTERAYVVWQNRAFRFYLAGRLLHFNSIYGPACFCAQQAIELMLKATLLYWDKSFKPERAGHRFRPMLDALHNKGRGAETIVILEYFYAGGRYQSVSRYPSDKRPLIPIYASFLCDLDSVFCDLLRVVPFQFNSIFVNTLGDPDSDHCRTLERDNSRMAELSEFLEPWLKKHAGDLAPLPRD